MINTLDSKKKNFYEEISALGALAREDNEKISTSVNKIIADIETAGDEKLLEYTNLYDDRAEVSVESLLFDKKALETAYHSLDPNIKNALQLARDRVCFYHEKQLEASGSGLNWSYEDDQGNILGQFVRGMERVGIYVPGGKAAYPSTVIMTAVPARVAGVREIIVCVPAPRGVVSKTVLAAAHLCKVDRVFSIGGAQAIAALAFGTGLVPKVDKIVGPGNIYVATAKEKLFGRVGIDMIAGPSEVVIVADDSVDPTWVVQDMFAQAEHDELAQAIVISTSQSALDNVLRTMEKKIRKERRSGIIEQALRDRGALIKVRDLNEALKVVNFLSPEHLQLSIENASTFAKDVKNAGAVFVGARTTEAVGDYTAGPSHVLPTNGTARFSSPLGVYDFQTRTSIVECSREGSKRLNKTASIIALEEGLFSHSKSASLRSED
ncbi:histidinol dehydrogenase [Gammaproteobacteria bacterium]|nr:histidinol dehydrogenase [Gammaproteobacteria bacterium]